MVLMSSVISSGKNFNFFIMTTLNYTTQMQIDYGLLEIRKIRTNYLVSYSVTSTSTNTRTVVFSSTAGSPSCDKRQRRRVHACHDIGTKFGIFFYDYFHVIKKNMISSLANDDIKTKRRFWLSQRAKPAFLRRIHYSIKCPLRCFKTFYNAAAWNIRNRRTAREKLKLRTAEVRKRKYFAMRYLWEPKSFYNRALRINEEHPKFNRKYRRNTKTWESFGEILALRLFGLRKIKPFHPNHNFYTLLKKLRHTDLGRFLYEKKRRATKDMGYMGLHEWERNRLKLKGKSLPSYKAASACVKKFYLNQYNCSNIERISSFKKHMDDVWKKFRKKLKKRTRIPKFFIHKNKITKAIHIDKGNVHYKHWLSSVPIFKILYFMLLHTGVHKQSFFSDHNKMDVFLLKSCAPFSFLLKVISKTLKRTKVKRKIRKLKRKNKKLKKLKLYLRKKYFSFNFYTVSFFFQIYNSSWIHRISLLPLSPFEHRQIYKSLFCSTGTINNFNYINLLLSNAIWYNSDVVFFFSPIGFSFWFRRQTRFFFRYLRGIFSCKFTKKNVGKFLLKDLFFAKSKKFTWSPYRFCDDFMKHAYTGKDLQMAYLLVYKIYKRINKVFWYVFRKKEKVLKKNIVYNWYKLLNMNKGIPSSSSYSSARKARKARKARRARRYLYYLKVRNKVKRFLALTAVHTKYNLNNYKSKKKKSKKHNININKKTTHSESEIKSHRKQLKLMKKIRNSVRIYFLCLKHGVKLLALKKHYQNVKSYLKIVCVANSYDLSVLKKLSPKSRRNLFKVDKGEIKALLKLYKKKIDVAQERHYAQLEEKEKVWINKRKAFLKRQSQRRFRNSFWKKKKKLRKAWLRRNREWRKRQLRYLNRNRVHESGISKVKRVLARMRLYKIHKKYSLSFVSSASLDYFKKNWSIFHVLNKYKTFVKHFFFFSDRVCFSVTNKQTHNWPVALLYKQTKLFTKSFKKKKKKKFKKKKKKVCSFETGMFSSVTYHVHLFNKRTRTIRRRLFFFVLYFFIYFSFLPLLVKFFTPQSHSCFFFFAKFFLLFLMNKRKSKALLFRPVISFLCESLFFFRSVFVLSKLKKNNGFGLRHFFSLSLRNPKQNKRCHTILLNTHKRVLSYSVSLFCVLSTSFLLKVKYTFFIFFLSELKFHKTNTLHKLMGYYYFTSSLFCIGLNKNLKQFFFFTIVSIFTFISKTFSVIDSYYFFFSGQTILTDNLFKLYISVPTYLYADLSVWDMDFFFSLVYDKVRTNMKPLVKKCYKSFKLFPSILEEIKGQAKVCGHWSLENQRVDNTMKYSLYYRPHKPFNGCRKRKKKKNRRYNR